METFFADSPTMASTYLLEDISLLITVRCAHESCRECSYVSATLL